MNKIKRILTFWQCRRKDESILTCYCKEVTHLKGTNTCPKCGLLIYGDGSATTETFYQFGSDRLS